MSAVRNIIARFPGANGTESPIQVEERPLLALLPLLLLQEALHLRKQRRRRRRRRRRRSQMTTWCVYDARGIALNHSYAVFKGFGLFD
jgi:hypothetical protein